MRAVELALSHLAPSFSKFAWPMLWQSSLLIGLLLIIDAALSRRLPPAVRYVLWLLVLVKLMLPPSLAFPTGVAWWIRPSTFTAEPARNAALLIRYGESQPSATSPETAFRGAHHLRTVLPRQAWLILFSAVGTLGLFTWMLRRWRQVAVAARSALPAPNEVQRLLESARDSIGLRHSVHLRMTHKTSSPVVFGFFRPVILLPASLLGRLSETQLRSVLLHELIHLRRGDVWVNCAQTLLQMFYWWHPLLWLANARIRQVREDAVDDAVMSALREEADAYPQTLLEVAKHALGRPLSSLALVGIMETRHALRRRIERLVDLAGPPKRGLTLASASGLLAFSALALPMGQAPLKPAEGSPPANSGPVEWPDPRFSKPEFVLLKEEKSPREAQNASVLPESDATAQNEKVDKLVQDARLLFELGKLDEADAPLREALAIDSRSPAAHYYLDLILKARGKPSSSVRFISVHTNQVAGPTTPQTVLAELSRIRLKQIAFDHQPLAEVVNMLNNEASPVVTFRMNPAESESSAEATKKEIGKVPITILPALTDVRLLDVLEVIVKVASERIRYSIESNEVVFSFRGSERKLYTRIMKVDPIAFVAALSQASGNGDLSPEATLTALRELLLKQGVTLQTPETLFFNDREGTVLIHTTLEKLALIERTVAELSNLPAQLNVKTRFLRLSDSLMRSLWTAIGVTKTDATNFSKILTPAQTSVLLRAISAKDHHNLINEASVTTLSGRQAEVQCVELKTILSNNVPTQIPLGPTIDMTPILGHDGWKIGLRIVTTLRELTGYDEPPDRATLEDPANLSKASGPLPHIRLRQLSAHSTVPDGYSLILANPLDAKDELAGKPGDLDSHYVVLITPTVIDSAGNRVHTDTEIESLSK